MCSSCHVMQCGLILVWRAYKSENIGWIRFVYLVHSIEQQETGNVLIFSALFFAFFYVAQRGEFFVHREVGLFLGHVQPTRKFGFECVQWLCISVLFSFGSFNYTQSTNFFIRNNDLAPLANFFSLLWFFLFLVSLNFPENVFDHEIDAKKRAVSSMDPNAVIKPNSVLARRLLCLVVRTLIVFLEVELEFLVNRFRVACTGFAK